MVLPTLGTWWSSFRKAEGATRPCDWVAINGGSGLSFWADIYPLALVGAVPKYPATLKLRVDGGAETDKIQS